MTEHIDIPVPDKKEDIYKAIIPQIKALVENEKDLIANMANTAAVLKTVFGYYWIGFYIVKGNELVLGPFQGPVACTRIKFGKGVCGTAWKEGKIINVPDVNRFPGHIACSSASKSEIVIPGFWNNTVQFVLDIDSDQWASFNSIDARYLEKITEEITTHSYI